MKATISEFGLTFILSMVLLICGIGFLPYNFITSAILILLGTFICGVIMGSELNK